MKKVEVRLIRPLLIDGTHSTDVYVEHEGYSICDIRSRMEFKNPIRCLARVREMFSYHLREYKLNKELFGISCVWFKSGGRHTITTNEQMRRYHYKQMVALRAVEYRILSASIRIELQSQARVA